MAGARRRRTNNRYNVFYYNSTNLPEGQELTNRINQCEGQSEQFLLLFELYKNLTTWEARRKYIDHFQQIDERQPGRAIRSLCIAGVVYKSTEQIREHTGALNNVYKLWPEDGHFPEDFDMLTLEKVHVPLIFDTEVGQPNALLTLNSFIEKLNEKLVEYGVEPIKVKIETNEPN